MARSTAVMKLAPLLGASVLACLTPTPTQAQTPVTSWQPVFATFYGPPPPLRLPTLRMRGTRCAYSVFKSIV